MATKSSTSGKASNRIVIGSLPDSITPFKLKDLLATIGPIEVRDVNVSLEKSVDKCCKKMFFLSSYAIWTQTYLFVIHNVVRSCC